MGYQKLIICLSFKQLSLFIPPFPIHPELIFLGHGREEKNNDKIYLIYNFDKIFFLSFRFCMIVVSIFWPLSYYTVLRLIFYPMNLIQLFFKSIFFFSSVFPTTKVPIFCDSFTTVVSSIFLASVSLFLPFHSLKYSPSPPFSSALKQL